MYVRNHVKYGTVTGESLTGHVWTTVYNNDGTAIYSRGFNPNYDNKTAQWGGEPGFATDDQDYGPANWVGPSIPITQEQFDRFKNFADRTNGTATWDPYGGNGSTGFNCATWARSAFNEMGIPLGEASTNWWPNNFEDSFSPRTEPGAGFDPLGNPTGVPTDVNRDYNASRGWSVPRDPLVLDLDGDGIETVGINPSAPILFDHDADGTRTGTGWVKSDDGLLVLDVNGNGTIDSGRELFGDNTRLGTGSNATNASNGYQALGQYDSNGDGQINSTDAIYSQLRVWRDLNQDGISQAGELQTLAQTGIASIGVAGTASNTNLGNGNTQVFSGTFTRTNGTAGQSGVAELSGSLLLASNNFYRQFTDNPALTTAAKALPQMQGSGWVRDMREAFLTSAY